MSRGAPPPFRRLERLGRRARRRLFVLIVAGVVGLTAPAWMPRLLAALPAFRVQRVEIVGTRYVAPDSLARLAAVEPDASVWDDPGRWEARVETHPLVEDARVRRDGLRTLEIRVEEKRPVALVATPELVPVSAEGVALPLEPWRAGLDLPVIAGGVELREGRIADRRALELVGLLDRLGAADAGFLAQVSEVGHAAGGGYELLMMPGADAGRVLLPAEAPVRGLRRIALALGQLEDARVARVDARYAGQVVLAPEEGS